MNDSLQSGFRIGDWEVYPQENLLKGPDRAQVLEPKVMDVLVFLAGRQGDVVSRQRLLDTVWAGVVVGDETLSRAISVLRTELGDEQKDPRYLKTISKRGYRLIAEVIPLGSEGPQDVASVGPQRGASVSDASASAAPERPTTLISERTRRNIFRGATIGLIAIVLLYLVLDQTVLEKAPSEAARAEIDKSIAVLPFRNRSAVAEDVFFIDGIHDDILTQLARLSSLERVISRTSMEQYRETTKSMPQIGKELGVESILEGGVQRAGDRVRINVQLIDAATDEHLWVETYDRQLTVENLFAIQSEISREVVAALHGVLTDEETKRLQTVPTTSFEAYGEYVLGRQQLANRTTGELYRAKAHFEKAIEIDPDYALAYVGLADSISILSSYATLRSRDSFRQRQAAIDKALALDPLLGEAYASLATVKAHQFKFREAEEYVLKAIELSPNYASAHHWYAENLRGAGNYEAALQHNYRALELDPMAPINTLSLSMTLWDLGRVEESQATLLQGMGRNRQFPDYYFTLAYQVSALGRVGEAMHWIQAASRVFPPNFGLMIAECQLYLQLDDDLSAERCFDSLKEAFPERGWGWRVELYRFRSQYQEAVELSEQVAQRFPTPRVRLGLAWDYLNNGEEAKARSILQDVAPDLFGNEEVIIRPREFRRGTALVAYMLYVDSKLDRANFLFEQMLETMQSMPRIRGAGYDTWDVFIHVVRGDKQKAISTLREAIDTGWRQYWWRLRFPAFDSMREESEWNALVSELEADIERQRQWYEEHKDDPLF